MIKRFTEDTKPIFDTGANTTNASSTTVTYSGGFESYEPTHIRFSRQQIRKMKQILADPKLTDGQKEFKINKIRKENDIALIRTKKRKEQHFYVRKNVK